MVVFYICPVNTDISATVAPIGVKICTMLHIGPGRSSPLLGRCPRGSPNPKFWA